MSLDKIALMNKARLKKIKAKYACVEKDALKSFRKHISEPLFASGISLYWAEGTRLSDKYRKYQLALTNSDSELLIFYCRFIRTYFKSLQNQDIRAALFVYPDININSAISHWSRCLNVPAGQFIKTQILPVRSNNGRKLKYGTCCVYLNSKEACLTMRAWINALSDSMRG